MRFPLPAYVTVTAGLGAISAGALVAASRPLTAVTLLAAAALAAELLEEPDELRSRAPCGPGAFRVASGVHLAAVIVLGPWRGALVAGAGVLLARAGSSSWREASFRSAALALASLAGGYAFILGGAHPGALALPADLVSISCLALAYHVVSRGLLDLVWGGEPFQLGLGVAAAETSLGAVVALFALDHPWNIVALLPVALAVSRAHAHVRRSQLETLHALETFANIVDERDPSTYRHSVRVAGYVDSFARALGLPFSDIDRLRWAGRLHDVGKVAIDVSTLRKNTKLTSAEWGAIWRAPRLSARLLQRFELSASQARAVELQHERFDGRGYYGVPGEELPLASHFLIVADSYDAMQTDRPYRRALAKEEALAEIERHIGSQFHPAVAKAFVAHERGRDPYSALTPEEADELRNAAVPRRVAAVPGTRDLTQRPDLLALAGLLTALAGAGLRMPAVAFLGALAAAAGLFLRAWARLRTTRVRGAVRAALAGDDRAVIFSRLAAVLEQAAGAGWVGLVRWEEDGLGGSLETSCGDPPAEQALMSWLVRYAECRSDLLVAPARDLGGDDGVYTALPLRRENSALVGFVVLRTARTLQRHIAGALSSSLDAIGLVLAQRPDDAEPVESAA
ncbi:MAG TPA: HD domain-containing phosphohydrolase [Gaiellaceae bacterium]|nr:HD domain-containing phosphohydrolase [Gaiellaceae bacterium]